MLKQLYTQSLLRVRVNSLRLTGRAFRLSSPSLLEIQACTRHSSSTASSSIDGAHHNERVHQVRSTISISKIMLPLCSSDRIGHMRDLPLILTYWTRRLRSLWPYQQWSTTRALWDCWFCSRACQPGSGRTKDSNDSNIEQNTIGITW